MKTISEHIKTVKGKPHHIRKRIAFTAAGVGAGIIGLIWLVTSVSTGVFALKPTSFAESSGAETVATVPTDANSGEVAGAAAAMNDADAPAHIQIVDVATSSGPKAQPTTIPF